MSESSVSLRLICLLLTVLSLAGCASSLHRAPVEDRGSGYRGAANAPSANGSAEGARPALGTENAGKPGYYTVKPGDTLFRLSLEVGQNWRDIVAWNNLDKPNVLEAGRVLRVVPPGQDPSVVVLRPIGQNKFDPKVPEGRPVAGGAQASTSTSATGPASVSAPGMAPATVAATGDSDEDLTWVWPAQGGIISRFEEGKNKGIGVAGKAGDPVVSAADGRVVYAGSGVHGYGNLVIVKHNATYLTAYAHNQSLLVKEEQTVRRGQKIAEMGSTEADRVQLHFEIRRQGRAVDPTKLLPPR